MSFEKLLEHFASIGLWVPLLSTPILLFVFVLDGKGRTRPAWLFSLSVPGLLHPALVLWGMIDHYIAPYPSDLSLRDAGDIAVMSALIFPGLWIFPLVCAIQVKNMVGGVWKPMDRASIAFCLFLLCLHLWNVTVVYLDPD